MWTLTPLLRCHFWHIRFFKNGLSPGAEHVAQFWKQFYFVRRWKEVISSICFENIIDMMDMLRTVTH